MSKAAYAREATGLVREYSTIDVFYIGISILGIGTALSELITWTPYMYPGANLPLMMFFGLIVSVFIGLNFILMAVAMPRSGGDYIFISRTLGPRWGFLANWTLVVQNMCFVAIDTTLFTSMFVAGMFYTTGVATSNAGMMDLGGLIATPPVGFAIAAVAIVFYAIVTGVGGRSYKWVTLIFMSLALLSVVLLIAVFALSSHASFVSTFNSLTKGALSYEQVVDKAKGLGYVIPGFSLAATVAGLPYAVMFYAGFERGTYVAGETKRISRAMPIGVLLSLAIGGVALMIIPVVLFNLVGEGWFKSLLYLYYDQPKVYPLPVPPSPNILAALAAPAALVAVFGFTYMFWGMMNNIARFQVFSRCIFAWSFDRTFPVRFSRVSDRFHTPTYTVILFLVGTLIATALAYFTNALSFLLSIIGIGYLIRSFVHISATAMPYRKLSKAIYGLSPLKPSIGKLPLITVSGIIATIFFLYMSYQSYSTLIQKPFAAIVGPGIGAILFFGLGGLGIYQIAKMYWAKKGIDLNMAFQELPPE